jgi:hypothetical protein
MSNQRIPPSPFREFDKRKYEELRNSELCYLCLVTGIPLSDSLHTIDFMVEGPHSSDMMCWHCYDTEEEFGHIKPDTEVATRVFEFIKQFDRYRLQRLITD